jgi:hypothetical protein
MEEQTARGVPVFKSSRAANLHHVNFVGRPDGVRESAKHYLPRSVRVYELGRIWKKANPSSWETAPT